VTCGGNTRLRADDGLVATVEKQCAPKMPPTAYSYRRPMNSESNLNRKSMKETSVCELIRCVPQSAFWPLPDGHFHNEAWEMST
jgi:hypothetical protein